MLSRGKYLLDGWISPQSVTTDAVCQNNLVKNFIILLFASASASFPPPPNMKARSKKKKKKREKLQNIKIFSLGLNDLPRAMFFLIKSDWVVDTSCFPFAWQYVFVESWWRGWVGRKKVDGGKRGVEGRKPTSGLLQYVYFIHINSLSNQWFKLCNAIHLNNTLIRAGTRIFKWKASENFSQGKKLINIRETNQQLWTIDGDVSVVNIFLTQRLSDEGVCDVEANPYRFMFSGWAGESYYERSWPEYFIKVK